MAILITILAEIIAILFVDEIKAWMPCLSQRLLARAICRLPTELQTRYAEEWEAHMAEIPGELSKIIFSISLQSGARGIRRIHSNSVAPSKSTVERNIEEAEKPLGLTIGLLPEPDGRLAPFVISSTANAAILLTMILLGFVAKGAITNHRNYEKMIFQGNVINRTSSSFVTTITAQSTK